MEQTKIIRKKKSRVTLITVTAFLMAVALALSCVGIYLKISNKGNRPPMAETNPLDFSVDTWDGSVDGTNFVESYAGRTSLTKTINSASSFMHFVTQVNNGNTFENYTIYLNSNLDFNNKKVSAITGTFKGKFDGGHYLIMNANFNGTALFENIENATIKNIGLYNSKGNLVNKATNSNIESSFVRLGNGLLVNEFISSKGAHHIKNSFVDSDAIGLVNIIDTNASRENIVSIQNCYRTNGETFVAPSVEQEYIVETNNIKATNKSDFASFDYSSKYEDGKSWCDYSYRENSTKLDFTYPLQSGFVKTLTTGSFYEGVVTDKNGNMIADASNLAVAFEEADKTQEAEINLLVEKIFMEARAEVETAEVKINAVKNTTIVRGENNQDSMFVGTGSSKITIGEKAGVTTASGSSTRPTITLDGNREYIEENNLESGALIVAYGSQVEIHDNVVIKDNINNNEVGYGGAILLYNTKEKAEISGKFENCSSINGGGAICAVGTAINSKETIYDGCSSKGNGGAVCIVDELPQASTEVMRVLYGENLAIKPMTDYTEQQTTITTITGADTFQNCTASNGYGGAIYLSSGNLSISSAAKFSFNSATYNGGAIYATSVEISGDSMFTGNSGGNGGAIYATSIEISGNATFDGNSASGNGGGAIYTTGSLSITTNPTFKSNIASNGAGGAIYSKGPFAINNGTFNNNKSGNRYSGGGAIYCSTTEASTLTGGTFIANYATSCGGGAIHYIGGKLYIDGDVVFGGESESLGNKATGSYSGGALYVANSELIIRSGSSLFQNNYSYHDGGAISCNRVIIEEGGNAIFINNEAEERGGAIYATSIEISGNATFDRNSAGGNGGAIYANTDMTIEGSPTFTSNTSSANGGAIFVIQSGPVVEITGNPIFKSNSCSSGEGTAIYFDIAENPIISGNITLDGNYSTVSNGIKYGGYELYISCNGLTLQNDINMINTVSVAALGFGDGYLEVHNSDAGTWTGLTKPITVYDESNATASSENIICTSTSPEDGTMTLLAHELQATFVNGYAAVAFYYGGFTLEEFGSGSWVIPSNLSDATTISVSDYVAIACFPIVSYDYDDTISYIMQDGGGIGETGYYITTENLPITFSYGEGSYNDHIWFSDSTGDPITSLTIEADEFPYYLGSSMWVHVPNAEDDNSTVSWTSSNTSVIASGSQRAYDGKIGFGSLYGDDYYAQAAGTTILTASITLDGTTYTASCVVTVFSPSVELISSSISTTVGGTIDQTIISSEDGWGSLTWILLKTSDASVVAVDPYQNEEGNDYHINTGDYTYNISEFLTPVGVGTATISIYYSYENTLLNTFTVTVTEGSSSGDSEPWFTLDKTSVEITVGGTIDVICTLTSVYDSGLFLFTLSSNNTNVVSVDDVGSYDGETCHFALYKGNDGEDVGYSSSSCSSYLQAVGTGTATITVSMYNNDANYTTTLTFTVTVSGVSSTVSIDKTNVTAELGGYEYTVFSLNFTFENCSGSEYYFEFYSNNESVVKPYATDSWYYNKFSISSNSFTKTVNAINNEGSSPNSGLNVYGSGNATLTIRVYKYVDGMDDTLINTFTVNITITEDVEDKFSLSLSATEIETIVGGSVNVSLGVDSYPGGSCWVETITSSAPSVVAVDYDGSFGTADPGTIDLSSAFTVVGTGTATITLDIQSGEYSIIRTFTVTVTAASSVTINKTEETAQLGGELNLYVTADCDIAVSASSNNTSVVDFYSGGHNPDFSGLDAYCTAFANSKCSLGSGDGNDVTGLYIVGIGVATITVNVYSIAEGSDEYTVGTLLKTFTVNVTVEAGEVDESVFKLSATEVSVEGHKGYTNVTMASTTGAQVEIISSNSSVISVYNSSYSNASDPYSNVSVDNHISINGANYVGETVVLTFKVSEYGSSTVIGIATLTVHIVAPTSVGASISATEISMELEDEINVSISSSEGANAYLSSNNASVVRVTEEVVNNAGDPLYANLKDYLEVVGYGTAVITIQFTEYFTSTDVEVFTLTIEVIRGAEVTLSTTSISMYAGKNANFTYSSTVDGTFTITSGNTAVAQVYANASVKANMTYTAIVEGLTVGNATITVAFVPSDGSISNPANQTVSVTVSQAPTISFKQEVLTETLNEFSSNSVRYTVSHAGYIEFSLSNPIFSWDQGNVFDMIGWTFEAGEYDISGAYGMGVYEANCGTAILTAHYYSDNSQTVLWGTDSITIHITEPVLSDPTGLTWDAETSVGSWGSVNNATSYEIQLYKDGVVVGEKVSSTTNSYDFSPLIKENGKGSYTYSVTAKNAEYQSSQTITSFALEAVTVRAISSNATYGTVNISSFISQPNVEIVVNGSTVTIGSTTITATALTSEQYAYAFTGWTGLGGMTTLTRDLVLVANFERTLKNYNVKFEVDSASAGYGTIANAESKTSVSVPYGTMISFNENVVTVGGTTIFVATPSASTENYTYNFLSWKGAVSVVEGATTIYAQFTRTTNKYTITFVSNNEDYGTVSHSAITVDYGTTIGEIGGGVLEICGEHIIPTPETNTTNYKYNFVGWSGIVSPVIANITITANFEQVPNTFTVTFNVNITGYGSVSTNKLDVAYGSVIYIKDNIVTIDGGHVIATATDTTAQYAYVFKNWTGAVDGNTVEGAMTITANFERTTRQYTISINIDNGSVNVIEPITVSYGSKIVVKDNTITITDKNTGAETVVTATPNADYKFVEWIGVVGSVEGDIEIVASCVAVS